jgi:hypothetical protein
MNKTLNCPIPYPSLPQQREGSLVNENFENRSYEEDILRTCSMKSPPLWGIKRQPKEVYQIKSLIFDTLTSNSR